MLYKFSSLLVGILLTQSMGKGYSVSMGKMYSV